jgi:hypothetical protein
LKQINFVLTTAGIAPFIRAIGLLDFDVGFPNVMVMDGAKAQVEGDFRRKLRDTGCYIKQTEPHTQSSNMGE